MASVLFSIGVTKGESHPGQEVLVKQRPCKQWRQAMHWHLRDKDAKQKKRKTANQRHRLGRNPDREAKKRTTDMMERIPLQLEQQSDQAGVLKSTINPNAAANVQNSASSPAPASVTSVATFSFQEFNEAGGYASVYDTAFLCCLLRHRQWVQVSRHLLQPLLRCRSHEWFVSCKSWELICGAGKPVNAWQSSNKFDENDRNKETAGSVSMRVSSGKLWKSQWFRWIFTQKQLLCRIKYPRIWNVLLAWNKVSQEKNCWGWNDFNSIVLKLMNCGLRTGLNAAGGLLQQAKNASTNQRSRHKVHPTTILLPSRFNGKLIESRKDTALLKIKQRGINIPGCSLRILPCCLVQATVEEDTCNNEISWTDVGVLRISLRNNETWNLRVLEVLQSQ
jgi:hypothetical protein